jgi:hypothetical protein
MSPRSLAVALIDRGERVSPRFIVRRPLGEVPDPEWRDEDAGDDPAIADWAADAKARILGRPLARIIFWRRSP